MKDNFQFHARQFSEDTFEKLMNFHVESEIRLGYSVQKAVQPIGCFFMENYMDERFVKKMHF